MENKTNIKREPTAKDWDKIRALYMREETLDNILLSLPNVNLTKRQIIAKMNKSGATARRKALNDTVMDNLQKTIEKEKIKTNEECINLYESGAKIINCLLKQYYSEAKAGDVPKSKAKATAYNIDLLMSGVTKIQKGLRVCYGMDDNNKLYEKEPEMLVIEGLNLEEI